MDFSHSVQKRNLSRGPERWGVGSETAICCRNALYTHGYHGDVLKGSFELLHEIVHFKIIQLKVFEDAETGSSTVNQAYPTVAIIFEAT